MNEFASIINNLGSPIADIVWVALLTGVLYLVVFIIVKFVERKEVATEEIIEEPKEPQDVSGFKSPKVEKLEAETKDEQVEIPDEFTSPNVGNAERIQEHIFETSRIEEIKITPEKEVLESKALPEEVERVEEEISQESKESSIEPEPELTKEGLFSRLREGLSKTHTGLFGRLDQILSTKEVNEELWDEFEELLISSDIGVPTTMKLRGNLETNLSKQSLSDSSQIINALKDEVLEILKNAEGNKVEIVNKPTVLMVAGVNGVGKTTTIGKLASKFVQEGKSVMVAAGDTFRAAAIEQLEIWANRVGSDFIKGSPGTDPSAVAFDAIKSSQARGTDVLIIDTAGRLHTKLNLMEELKKIKKVIGREAEGAPHEILLVLDATTGQNAVQQAKTFNEAIDVSGIALTKLDGTAKGGVIIAIADELNIPVKYIGIGESLSDLREFNAKEFVEALFLSGEETLH